MVFFKPKKALDFCNYFIERACVLTVQFDGYEAIPSSESLFYCYLTMISFFIEFLKTGLILYFRSTPIRFYLGELVIVSSSRQYGMTFCECMVNFTFLIMHLRYEKEVRPPVQFRWMSFGHISLDFLKKAFFSSQIHRKFIKKCKIYFYVLRLGDIVFVFFLTVMSLRSVDNAVAYFAFSPKICIPILLIMQKIYNYRRASAICLCNYTLFALTTLYLEMYNNDILTLLRNSRQKKLSFTKKVTHNTIRFLRSYNKMLRYFKESKNFFAEIYKYFYAVAVGVIMTTIHMLWFDTMSFAVYILLTIFGFVFITIFDTRQAIFQLFSSVFLLVS